MTSDPRPDENEGLPQEKVDSEWQNIIAGFGEAPRMPAANDDVPGAQLTPASSDWDPLAEDTSTFVPPEPPPIPRPHHAVDRFAWAGLLGGPIVVLLAFFFTLPSWIAGLGALAFAGGFATLIARKNDDRDGPHDGAVV
jgi:hypothetical protein